MAHSELRQSWASTDFLEYEYEYEYQPLEYEYEYEYRPFEYEYEYEYQSFEYEYEYEYSKNPLRNKNFEYKFFKTCVPVVKYSYQVCTSVFNIRFWREN